jgi:hypothetical protein
VGAEFLHERRGIRFSQKFRRWASALFGSTHCVIQMDQKALSVE